MLPDRRATETKPAYAALCDYCQMGAGRSLAALLDRYQTATKPPPTKREKTLKDWSRFNEWQARAGAYDKAVAEAMEQALQAKRREVMEEGLALDFERVRALKRLADLLESEVYEEDKRWVPDVKGIGKGEDFERVDIVRFNPAVIDQFRGTLDDIAKEVGDRKQKTELTGKDGGPIEHKAVGQPLDDGARVTRLLGLFNRVRTRTAGPPAGGGADLDPAVGSADGSVPK